MYIKRLFFTAIFLFSFLALSFTEDDRQIVRLNKGSVSEVVYSPDGQSLAVAGGLGIWLYPINSDELPVLIEYPYLVRDISFSGNGKTLAGIALDGNVLLWDVKTGEIQQKLESIRNLINISLSPNGQFLAIARADGFIHLWDVWTEEFLYTLEVHPNSNVSALMFSPDGQTLATGGNDVVQLWNVAIGDLLHTLIGHPDRVISVAFSPDGKVLASCGLDRTILLWDVQTGTLHNRVTGSADWVFSLSFSPDGQTLAAAGTGGKIELWDVSSNKLRNTLTGNIYGVNNVSFSTDGQSLASVSTQDSYVRIWNLSTNSLSHTLPGHSSSSPWELSFSSDGQTLANVSQGTVSLLDIRTGEILHTFMGHTASFSPNEKTVAIGGSDPNLRLLDVSTGIPLKTLELDIYSIIISFSKDGQNLGILDRDATIHLWDIKTDELRHTPTELDSFHGIRFHGRISFSPDLRFLAITRYDKRTDSHSTIHLLDVDNGKLLHTLYGHEDSVRSLSFSVDGKMLVSASWDKTVCLWKVSTGKLQNMLIGHAKRVNTIAFSPDGKTLASGGSDGTVYLWDVESCEQKDTLTKYSSEVTNLSFSPDGKTLAIGRRNGTIYVWRKVFDPPKPERHAADVNADGVVNIKDWVLVATDFGKMGEYVTDVNSDGTVNIQDLVVVVAAFDD